MTRIQLLEELATLRAWAHDTPKPETMPQIARYMRKRHDNDARETAILEELKKRARPKEH